MMSSPTQQTRLSSEQLLKKKSLSELLDNGLKALFIDEAFEHNSCLKNVARLIKVYRAIETIRANPICSSIGLTMASTALHFLGVGDYLAEGARLTLPLAAMIGISWASFSWFSPQASTHLSEESASSWNIQALFEEKMTQALQPLRESLDQQTQTIVSGLLSFQYSTFSGMQQGWVSWLISLFGASNPIININQMGVRAAVDQIELGITYHGIAWLLKNINAYRFDQKILKALYVTTSSNLYAQYQGTLIRAEKEIKELNEKLLHLFLTLDQLEATWGLKPGLITRTLGQLVKPLYEGLYSLGFSFGQEVEVYPFTTSRRTQAKQFKYQAHQNYGRFEETLTERYQLILTILNGRSLSYLIKLAEHDNIPAKIQLTRIFALALNFSQSECLHNIKNEQTNFQELARFIKQAIIKEQAPELYDRPWCMDTSEETASVTTSHSPSSLENYFKGHNAHQLKHLQTVEIAELKQYLLTLIDVEQNNLFQQFQYVMRLVERELGTKGRVMEDLKLLRRQGKTCLVRLQNEIFRITNDRQLQPEQQLLLVIAAVNHFCPAGSVLFPFAEKIIEYGKQEDFFQRLREYRLRGIIYQPYELRCSKSADILNFFELQVGYKGEILYSLLENLSTDTGDRKHLENLVLNLKNAYFNSSLTEEEVIQEMRQTIETTISNCEEPLIKGLLFWLSQPFFNVHEGEIAPPEVYVPIKESLPNFNYQLLSTAQLSEREQTRIHSFLLLLQQWRLTPDTALSQLNNFHQRFIQAYQQEFLSTPVLYRQQSHFIKNYIANTQEITAKNVHSHPVWALWGNLFKNNLAGNETRGGKAFVQLSQEEQELKNQLISNPSLAQSQEAFNGPELG